MKLSLFQKNIPKTLKTNIQLTVVCFIPLQINLLKELKMEIFKLTNLKY